jgi:hypothetical protein
MPYFKITETKKKTSQIIKEMRELFPVYVYDEENVDKNFPVPKKMTTRYFNKTVEVDENMANKSANDLESVECISLRERLLMEIQYYKETRKHLDIDNWTLCAGSRYANGDVPRVDWLGGKLWVSWFDVGSRDGGLRSRVAVNPSSLNLVPLPPFIMVGEAKYVRE